MTIAKVGTPGIQPADAQPAWVTDAANEARSLLRTLGFEVAESGALDTALAAALREFQEDNGIAQTGSPDPATLSALRNNAGAGTGAANLVSQGPRTFDFMEGAFGAPADSASTIKAGALAFAHARPTGRAATGATPTDLSDNTVVAASKTPLQMRAPVPFYSQFEGGHGYTPGDKACAKAAKAMAAAGGATPGSMADRIQVGTSEDRLGRLKINPERAREANTYLDNQLAAGKPVVVGVSHADNRINADGLTDHFVTITGKGVDERGRTFYAFADPATRNASKGADTNPNNRFIVGNDGKLVRDGSLSTGFVADRRFEMTAVVKNR